MIRKKSDNNKVHVDPRRLAVKVVALILAVCMIFSIAASLIFYFVYNG